MQSASSDRVRGQLSPRSQADKSDDSKLGGPAKSLASKALLTDTAKGFKPLLVPGQDGRRCPVSELLRVGPRSAADQARILLASITIAGGNSNQNDCKGSKENKAMMIPISSPRVDSSKFCLLPQTG